MVRIREYEPADWRFHDEHTWYQASVAGIEDDEFSHGPVVKFILNLDEDDEDRDVHAIATDRLTPKSKLTQWTKGLFGEDAISEGKTVDLDDAAGMRVEVMFKHGTNSAGEPNETVTLLRRADQGQELVEELPDPV